MTPSPPIPKFRLQSFSDSSGVKLGVSRSRSSMRMKSFPRPSYLEKSIKVLVALSEVEVVRPGSDMDVHALEACNPESRARIESFMVMSKMNARCKNTTTVRRSEVPPARLRVFVVRISTRIAHFRACWESTAPTRYRAVRKCSEARREAFYHGDRRTC